MKRELGQVEEVERMVRRGRGEITGVLRIACSVGFDRFQIVPRLQRFLASHPQVRIDLRMSDAMVDLIEGGIDVAIRIGELPESGFIALRLGTTHRVVVAAPAYLKSRKLPKHPGEVEAHECIVYRGLATRNEWRFEGPRHSPAPRSRFDGAQWRLCRLASR